MGQKSRNKKVRNKWIQKTPDEAFGYGPIRIERYGRYLRFSNNSTPEEHSAFLKRSEEAHKELKIDLAHEVLVLQGLVRQQDPLELMHRAAYMLLPLFTQNKSENELSYKESYYLPAVEYLQYLIARTEAITSNKKLKEKDWELLWDQLLKVLNLTQSYLLTRNPLSTPPSAIDELRFILDNRRLIIRVRRYPTFFSDHLRSSLAPYEQWLQRTYGIGAEDIISGLNIVEEYQKRGVLGRYHDVHEMDGIVAKKLLEKGYRIDRHSPPEEVERTRAALETTDLKSLYLEMQEKMRLAFTPAIFEITDLTILPKPLLSLLSVKPGESVLTTLTGPGPDYEDLSPLSNSMLHFKPFLEINGKYYTFYHSGFEDKISEIFQADLFKKYPEQVSIMAKKRSDRVESDTKDLLISIIKPDFVFQNVYYPNPDHAGHLTELDILFGAGDVLFLVEAKAGGFSDSASRGAPSSIEQELSDLIIEGQRQSERAERYIKSDAEAVFFDETGKQEVHRIRYSNFRKLFRIIVTREDLGWVGAKMATLSVLEPKLSESYPWHISLDDLRVVAELFSDSEVRFVHYLEQRLLASAEVNLNQGDEIEHVALYNKMNIYHDLPVQGMNRMSFDPSYMRDIDHYFMDKAGGDTPPLPTQEMPEKLGAFIKALQVSRLKSRFEVGSILLSMGTEGRNQFKEGLDRLDQGRMEGKERTFRMPFTALSFGLSVTYAGDDFWEEELRRSAVQMEHGGCQRWLVAQLANKTPYEVAKIEVLGPGRFSNQELVSARLRHDRKTDQAVVIEKTGRNEPCPCGSGKKYKKCHWLV